MLICHTKLQPQSFSFCYIKLYYILHRSIEMGCRMCVSERERERYRQKEEGGRRRGWEGGGDVAS